MKTVEITLQEIFARTSISILSRIFKNYPKRNFTIRLWDGSVLESQSGQPQFTMVINHPGALRKMFLGMNELSLGEAYIYDDFDIEGNIEAVFQVAENLFSSNFTLAEKIQLGLQLRKLPVFEKTRTGRKGAILKGALHSRERDRQAVTYHYDVSNDFFALWLDPLMSYSCAYYNSPMEDLNIAQERKLDYICRKLRLNKGERLLDVGCGWGGLLIYAAKHYGVKALGITLSEPQAEIAQQRIRKEGLSDLCKVEVRDYRDVDEKDLFDKIVSVGMFEHVGESMLPEYFHRVNKLLKAGGVFLNHGIAMGINQPKHNGVSFSDKYVFPDSQLLPISATLQIAEKNGFEVRDVENLREHYMLTLRSWLKRLEANHQEILHITDETTYRIWRLNHAGSAHGFENGRLAIYQSLLLKPEEGKSKLPLTRSDWYQASLFDNQNYRIHKIRTDISN